MEWQPGGLTWALDNWLYMTYNPFRLRIAPGGKVLREETEPNGGQWWSAQDNYGKTWWVDGGGELGPVNFQAPIQYGAFNVPDNFEPDFRVPWPAPGGIADMQGGMNRVRMPDGTLNHFTAASGVEIYRGHRLPQDLAGDLFFNEPVGRIVRRAKVVVREGLTQLQNAYPKSEFVRSTDPLFRPVAIHNTPDGTLMLVDMYTGIIQDAQFVGPNSYLRRKVDQYKLDAIHNFGRIWRITHDSTPPHQRAAADVQRDARPARSPSRARERLVARHRAEAARAQTGQERRRRAADDGASGMRTSWRGSMRCGRWKGSTRSMPQLVRELMKSPDPQIRIQAIRASETLYKAKDKSFAADYKAMMEDRDANVVIQAMLTLNLHKVPDYDKMIRATRGERDGARRPGDRQPDSAPAVVDGAAAVARRHGGERLELLDRSAPRAGPRRGHLQGALHHLSRARRRGRADGRRSRGHAAGAAAGELDRASPDIATTSISVLLHGLTGPIGDKEYPGGVMVPMGTNTDQWIADVANYVRNSFGNSGLFVTPQQVAFARAGTPRKTPWTLPELEAALPKALTNQAEWKLSASHNSEAAANATGTTPGARWDTGRRGAAGRHVVPDRAAAAGARRRGADRHGAAIQLRRPRPRRWRPWCAGRRRARRRAARLRPARDAAARRFRSPVPSPTRCRCRWTERPGARRSRKAPASAPTTVIAFTPVQAKFVRITQTGAAAGERAVGDCAGQGVRQVSGIDYAIVILYFGIVFGIGAYFFRRAKTSRSYFLADKSVGWIAVGASLFASNISSEHFIGLAGSGASSGLAVGHFEWLAVFMCMTLAWVFVPFYLRTNVYTMPEFLERRYGPACRWYLTTVSILAYVFTKISVSLYAGALVLRATVGWDFYTSAAVMVVATGIYTIFGGLAAVIYTEFLQAVVLLAGAIALTVIGLVEVGGMAGLRQALPPDFFHMMRPASDAAFPWTGIFFGAPILGIWYWCTDQMIVQRVLGAKTEEDARGGALFCGLLKVLPVFVLVLPGLIARALYPDIKGDDAYPTLVVRLLPAGMIGLMVAALLAALMSSLSATFNSASTLITFDVYKKLNPQASEARLVAVGRSFTVVMVVLGILWVPFIQVSEHRGLHLPAERAGLHQPADCGGVPVRRVLAARQPPRRDHRARGRGDPRFGPVHPRVEPRLGHRAVTADCAARHDELPALRGGAVRGQRRAAGGVSLLTAPTALAQCRARWPSCAA